MPLRPLLLTLLALGAVPSLPAQEFDSTTVFGRIYTRRMAALAEDPTMKEMAELNSLPTDAFNPSQFTHLDDASVVLFARLMSQTLDRLNFAECVAAMTGQGDELMQTVARVTDSVAAEQWVALLERVVWSAVNDDPPGATASPDQVGNAFRSILAHSDQRRQAFITKASETSGLAACELTPWLLRVLAAKRPERAAPLLRGVFAIGSSE